VPFAAVYWYRRAKGDSMNVYSGIKVTFECPELKREVTVEDVQVEGGCFGHDMSPDAYDYCYCDSVHLAVKCECTDKKGKAYFHSLYP